MEIVETIGKASFWERMPKWLRVVLIVVSIITLIYWVCFMLYWALEMFRRFLALISDKKGYWIFLSCLLIMTIAVLLLAQFSWGLNPFGIAWKWVCDTIEMLRKSLADLIYKG